MSIENRKMAHTLEKATNSILHTIRVLESKQKNFKDSIIIVLTGVRRYYFNK